MAEAYPMLENGVEAPQKSETKNQYIATICVCLGAVCAGSVLAWTSPVLPQLLIVTNKTTDGTSYGVNDTTTGLNGTTGGLNGTTGSLNDTMDAVVNIAINITTSDEGTEGFKLTESQGSLVGAMLAIGALCAAIPGGMLAERFGRKKANLFLTLPFVVNWLLIVFAMNPMMLYVARFFAGLATGAICVTAPMYIGEIADVSVRGTLGSFFQMSICFGIFLAYAFGAVTTWVCLSWILMIVPLIFAICFYFMPETPVYLVKKGRTSEARDSLKFFRGGAYNPEPELKVIQADIANAEKSNAGLKDLVASRGNKKALISSLGLMLFQQLSGINAVIFYTVPIFESAGTGLSPDLAAVLVAIVQCIVAYVAAMIIEKANRRFFLTLSSSGMGVCLALLGLFFHLKEHSVSFTGMGLLPLSSLVIFIVAFSLGLGPVPWMIMSELFAPEIKGVASGLAVMFNWGLVFLVTFSFPLMKSSLGGHVTFYIFAAVMAVGTFFIQVFIPETRGKTLQEIQVILNK